MIEWYSGRNNYLKHSHLLNTSDTNHTFITEILDVETRNCDNINQIFYDDLSIRQTKTVEVLYSGGMDSECLLRSCLINKIPVRAITGRFLVKGYPVNTHDLYYAEKFCRENNVEHKHVDLNVDHFFERGDHIKYLEPYLLWQSHVATHFWLFEQCTGFPVFGGEYSWPWVTKPVLSPHKLIFMCYDRFLKDNGIFGIGNMLGHSLDSNIMFIKHHIQTVNSKPDHYYNGGFPTITHLKQDIFKSMGLGELELRMKNYGWELVDRDVIDIHQYTDQLIKKYKLTYPSIIKWNKKIADIMGCEPGMNYLN